MKIQSKLAGGERGFSLLELLVVVVILSLVIGVVVNGLNRLVNVNSGETNKVDMTQESRQFIDQLSSDIHQAGFPNLRMYDPASGATLASFTVAQGLTLVDTNAVQFEGDVDGSGQVSKVFLQLVDGNGNLAVNPAGCPCTLQRGTVWKSVGGNPTFYTELTGVMNTNIFSAYDFGGNVVVPPQANALTGNLPNIKTVRMTVNIRSLIVDPIDNQYDTVTMVSEAKINN